MKRSFIVLATGLVVVIALGCGSSGQGSTPLDTNVGGGGGSGGGGTYDAGVDSGEVTSTSTGSFPDGGYSFQGALVGPDGGALAGASVCLLASPLACTTTNSGGGFLVTGMSAAEDGISASLNDYVTGRWPFTPTANITDFEGLLRTQASMAALAAEVGTTLSTTNGTVDFETTDSTGTPIAGVSIATSVQAGTTAYYVGTSLSLTATATTGDGAGFVFNLPPGTVALGFTAAGKTCAGGDFSGWAPGPGATVDVPIVAGETTRVVVACK